METAGNEQSMNQLVPFQMTPGFHIIQQINKVLTIYEPLKSFLNLTRKFKGWRI